MSSLTDILRKAISLVEPSPSEKENIRKIAEELRSKVEGLTVKRSEISSVELGGSYAKGTWLKGDVDIDIFVKFLPNIPKKCLEDIGIAIGKKALAGYRHYLRYSEHPYVEGIINGVKVNVVACYDVKQGLWKSAADRSPYHTLFIKSNLDNRLKTEVRILKKFLKVAGLYGAEIKTQGFSGYVSEVLVHKYGSFKSVLEAASSFNEGAVICVEEIDEDIAKNISTPVVILDPVDQRRNLGAAISPENIASFILDARNFLKNPKLDFLKESSVKDIYEELETSPLIENLLLAVFEHKSRTVDILWGQLKRSQRHLEKQILKAGFEVLRGSSASNELSSSGFIFLLDSQTLSQFQIKVGPKVHSAQDASKFLQKNESNAKLMWVTSDMRIHALSERKYWRASQVVRVLLGGEFNGSGVAPGLAQEIKDSFEIFTGTDVFKAVVGRSWLLEGINRVVFADRLSFGSSK